MNIKHVEKMNTFVATDDSGSVLGEIGYMRDADGRLCATHTKVFPPNEGKGIAAILLDALAQWAAEQGDTITPICSYVAAQFNKNPDKFEKVIPSK